MSLVNFSSPAPMEAAAAELRLSQRVALFLTSPPAAAIVLTLLALLVYANSFPGAFILDDIQIVRNSSLLSRVDLLTIFRSDYWHGVASSGLYRPLTVLTLAINRWICGDAVWGYHLVNVLLHAAVTVLLWSMLRRWDFSAVTAFWSAALFAVHPLHTEVVDVVVGRSELLVALLLLLAFAAARRSDVRGAAFTVGFFFCALLAKENAIVFVALLPIFDAFRSQRWQVWNDRWRLYAGVALVAGFWLILRKVAIISTLLPPEMSSIDTPLFFATGFERLLTGLVLQLLYLWKLFCPVNLQIFYNQTELPPIIGPYSLAGVLVGVVATTMIALLVLGWHRHSAPAFFAVLFFVSFLPTSNMILPIGVTFAERLSYFPSIWFCCAVACCCELGPRWRCSGKVWGTLALYLCFLGTLTLLRNGTFASEVDLYRAEIKENPEDIKGWINYAESLATAGAYPEADAAYERLFQINDGFVNGLRSRAIYYALTGRFAEARSSADAALAAGTKTGQVKTTYLMSELSAIYLLSGDPARALELYDAGVALRRGSSDKLELRGRILTALGRDEEAVETFSRSQELDGDSEALYGYALSLFRTGRLIEAQRHLEKSLQLVEHGEGWNLLAAILAQQGENRQAIEVLTRAVALEPENQHYQDNLRHLQGLPNKP